MKTKHHFASKLALTVAVGFVTMLTANTAEAQLFQRLRARLAEPLIQPQPAQRLPQQPQFQQPRPSQAQPQAQSPLRPVQPLTRGSSSIPTLRPTTPQTPRQLGSGSLGIDVEQDAVTMQGLRVTRISAQSLADEAGLREGDLIVAIDGQGTPTIESVVAVLRQRSAGDTVVARVIRERRLGQLRIPLIEKQTVQESPANRPVASAKPPTRQPETAPKPAIQQPKVAVTPAPVAKSVLKPVEPAPSAMDVAEPAITTDSILDRLGVQVEDAQVVRGAVVTEIAPQSISERLGLRIADRIVSVDDEFVFTANRFEWRLQQWNAKKPLKIQLIRDERLLTLSLDPSRLDTPNSAERDAVAESGVKNGQPANADDKENSMLEGVGSALGSFFAGKSKDSNQSSADKTPSALGAAPVVKADAELDADPLAFGDEEAVDQAAFEESGTPMVAPIERSLDVKPSSRPQPKSNSEADPPSLEALELPAGNLSKTPSKRATTKRGEELEAEIERLERQLEEMKAKADKKK
ncbi:PDZ domain-containing protein [Novipirellula sp. SH528]|uniref:PDZ domain-containing protein n=1 Tax=Novipirellula sp. SH528 TaxID=3454466 RepID=UPI003F9FCECE